MTARVALATCGPLPGGDEDAALLQEAFRRAGACACWQVWDDPAVDWERFDQVLLRSTWDYTARRTPFLAWTRQVPALRNPPAVVEWNSDKRYLRDLAAADIPVVPTGWSAADVELGLSGAGQVVLKPSVGAGSRGVGRFQLPQQAPAARAHLGALQAQGRTVLVQPFLEQVDALGETAVVCLGGVVSHAARKGPLLPPGVVHPLQAAPAGSAHALFVPERVAAAVASTAELVVTEQVLNFVERRFGVLAYARVDLLPSAEGPLLVELELVEPSLFLGFAPDPPAAADRLVRALL